MIKATIMQISILHIFVSQLQIQIWKITIANVENYFMALNTNLATCKIKKLSV